MSWQPIETAPKDGTEIILFVPGWRSPVLGHWWDEQTFKYGKPERIRQEWSVSGMMLFSDRPHPTFWMPIPPLPEQQEPPKE